MLEDNASVQSDNALVREFEINEQFVSAQIRTGAAPRSDLAAAQFQTAQARGALITAQGLAIAAEATFATTLGLDADTAISPQLLGSSPPQMRVLSYQQSLNEALKLRPDFLSAEHTVESDKENLRFAKLARFPSLEASASAGKERNLISTLNAGRAVFEPGHARRNAMRSRSSIRVKPTTQSRKPRRFWIKAAPH